MAASVPTHKRPKESWSFKRLERLWERYPKYHERTCFTTLEGLLEEHESYREDFEEEGLREEYEREGYERFLIQLSWSDLAYRHATMAKIVEAGDIPANPYVSAFMDQFQGIDSDEMACFIFPESFTSQFFVVREVIRRACEFRPIANMFPDEERTHYLALFDRSHVDDVLLMFHLLYRGGTEDFFGGYALYDYSLPWYQSHLWEDGCPFRSPYLPDRLAKFQGALPFHHNPTKTVHVRRNVEHLLSCGYITSELEFFLELTRRVMPLLHWWYYDLALLEEKDGIQVDWRLERTKIRTDLTAQGIIKPKWKHELSLFYAIRERFPDTLYQYRATWLGRQSLDLYVPSIETAIEYQGIQHYLPIDFFGGDQALELRQALDEQKRLRCQEQGVRLIEWPYELEPTRENVEKMLAAQKTAGT